MPDESELTRRAAIASGAVVVTTVVAGCTGGSGDDEDNGNDQQAIETSFNDGKEGWSAVDLTASDSASDPDWSNVIQSLDLTYESEGGVDNSGHVSRVDTTPNAFFFDAPDAYLGDMSAYVGGTVEYYLKSTHNNYRRDSAVILEGSDGVIATQFSKPKSDWTQFRIELDAEARAYQESNLVGSEVGQDRVKAVLSDLQALRISGEHGSAVKEEVALDQVQLRRP